jgi:hypothetical protein
MGHVYVHTGFMKTGSSFLQAFLAANVNELYRQGIAYPWANPTVGAQELVSSGNAADIAQYAYTSQHARVEARLAGLRDSKELGRMPVLLSSEYFSTWTGEKFEKLFSDLNSVGRIIVFLRDQADMIVAHYFHELKRQPFDQTEFHEYSSNYLKQNYLDFEAWLSDVDGISSISGLEVRSYGLPKLHHQLASALGLADVVGYSVPKRINVTPTQAELGLFRALGAYDISLRDADAIFDMIARFRRPLADGRNENNYFVDHDIILDIRERFRASNERVVERWFAGQSVDAVFSPRTYKPRTDFSLDSFRKDELFMILGGVAAGALRAIERR